MLQLLEILSEFKEKEIDLLYDKAVKILKLITDEEYELICEKNRQLIAPISDPKIGNTYIRDITVLNNIILIFIDTINKRRLSKEQFYILDLEITKSYMTTLINRIKNKSPQLFDIIDKLETIACPVA